MNHRTSSPALISGLALAFLFLGVAVPVFGQDEVTVTAVGNGTNYSEALADAQRKAVEQGAGVIIESSSQTENFVLVRDQIYTESKGFITSYREIARTPVDPRSGTCTVTIQATVSKKLVADSMAQYELMLKRVGRPKIMTCFRTRLNGKDLESQNFIIEIERPLVDAQFSMYDKRSFDAAKQTLLAEANLKDDINEMTRLAKDSGSDLLIRGDITAIEQRVEVGFEGVPAKVHFIWNFNYRIIRTTDSSVLAVYNRDVTVRPPNNAVLPEDANTTAIRVFAASGSGEANKTGLETRALMMSKWAFQAQNRTTFNLVITKSKYNDGKRLQEWLLSQQDWVSGVVLDGYKDGVTRMRVDSKMPKADDVASRLDGGSAAGMPVKLEVSEVDATTITCEVVGR